MSIFPSVTKEHLASVGIFEGLDDEALDGIARRCIAIGAHPAAKLVHQGESGFDFYMIHSGEAVVEVDGEQVATLGPGDVFGEMALLGGHHRRTADVVATSVMSLITMMVWDFREVIEEYPDLGHRLRALAEERLGS
ncbi:MAG: cyclic nucleotide-binding domain-containing protein [Acidimicrobiia bacterium]